jgi:hypothetical protein
MRMWLVPVALSLATFVGCAHMYSRDDLDVSLFQHDTDLRWGRLDNAAQNVKPEARGAFLTVWAKRMQELEIQDIEVAGVALSKDGDGADVVVNVTYIDKASMSVKSVTVPEHWVRTDQGWMIDKPASL